MKTEIVLVGTEKLWDLQQINSIILSKSFQKKRQIQIISIMFILFIYILYCKIFSIKNFFANSGLSNTIPGLFDSKSVSCIDLTKL